MTIATGCVSHGAITTGKNKEEAATPCFSGKKILIAYFSWGGTTQKVAENIQRLTGGDLFRIEPATPYPTEYTPCTEVARKERDENARPAMVGDVNKMDDYDIVFIGCPVWWHTAPMIISTFAERYQFKGKTVIPFCTYAATYRDETLKKIVDLTPDAEHLEGYGTTGDTKELKAWLDRINQVWTKKNAFGPSNREEGKKTLNLPATTNG